MNNLNSILLEGNLIKDPELRKHTEDTCLFMIAVKRHYKKDNKYQEEVSYFDVCTWSKLADACMAYLKKGSGVRVVGRLKQERWKDDQGNKCSRVVVIAEHVEFKPKIKRDNS